MFEVKREELLKSLKFVSPGLASRGLIEQSLKFAFMDGQLVTFNDEVSVSYPVPELSGLTCAVGAEFQSFLEKTKSKRLRIELSESELLISSGRMKAGFAVDSKIRLPVDEIEKPSDWHKVSGLADALRFVLPCCSKDLSFPVLTCVHFVFGSGYVEASNAIRHAKHNLDSGIRTGEALLPVNACKPLIGYDIEKISLGGSWIHFLTQSGAEVSCRLLEGNYPDHSHVTDFSGGGERVRLPENMKDALFRASIFAAREFETDEEVSLELKKDKVILNAKSESGWFKERMDLNYSGPSLEFSVHPRFLADACGLGTKVRFGKGKLQFKGSNWLQTIAVVGSPDDELPATTTPVDEIPF